MTYYPDKFPTTSGESWYGSKSGFSLEELEITEEPISNPIMSDIEGPDDSRIQEEYPNSDIKR